MVCISSYFAAFSAISQNALQDPSAANHQSLILIICMESIQHVPVHLCTFSILSSLPPQILSILKREKKSHILTCLQAFFFIGNHSEACTDLSRQQSKPHKDHQRQNLYADGIIVLVRKMSLTYILCSIAPWLDR